jgi:hypothetical protein
MGAHIILTHQSRTQILPDCGFRALGRLAETASTWGTAEETVAGTKGALNAWFLALTVNV